MLVLGIESDWCKLVASFEALLASGEVTLVVLEAFTISQRTLTVTRTDDALNIIGAIQYLCWRDKVECVQQKPSDVKPVVTDRVLKNIEFWHASDHARDAARHMAYRLAKMGLLSLSQGAHLRVASAT